MQDYDDAIILDPQDTVAYPNRARGNTLLGRDPQAQQDIVRAVELGFDRVRLEGTIQRLKSKR